MTVVQNLCDSCMTIGACDCPDRLKRHQRGKPAARAGNHPDGARPTMALIMAQA